MRLVLKVSSSNQHWNGGCEFALVELTPELAALALARIAALNAQKSADPDIDETYYWAYFVECYFDPWANVASAEKEVEAASLALAALLDQLQIQQKEVVTVPENFQVPPSQVAAVECEQMIVRPDAMAFMAIPKHAGLYVHTVEIPVSTLRVAAAASPSRP
jgi:sulfur carrier protein ThiS